MSCLSITSTSPSTVSSGTCGRQVLPSVTQLSNSLRSSMCGIPMAASI